MNSIATAFHRMHPEMAERAGFRPGPEDKPQTRRAKPPLPAVDFEWPRAARARRRPAGLTLALLAVCAVIGISVGAISPGIGQVAARTAPVAATHPVELAAAEGPVAAAAPAAQAAPEPRAADAALASLASRLEEVVVQTMESRIAALEAQVQTAIAAPGTASGAGAGRPAQTAAAMGSDFEIGAVPEAGIVPVVSSAELEAAAAEPVAPVEFELASAYALDPSVPEVLYEAAPVPEINGRLVSLDAAEGERPRAARPAPAGKPKHEAPASPTDGLRVEGIFWAKTRPMALINGQIVEVGSRIGNAKVTAINPGSVTLEINGREHTILP
ncbi:MAG: hypothetical protein BWZ08_02669 [candidate division BRC1 bacterium ADurb.BinA292]|nr:MAG: hypothetical protein BWZ08_02669 [candidate division BRC1 bacterium ADurb.BinA292]